MATDVRPRVAKELAENSGFLLVRLGMAFKERGLARLELEGLEPNQYGVLAMLSEGSRETQATIAEAIDLDPSRLVNLLDALEEEGLISRQRDPRDRRRHLVSITPAGTRRLAKLRAVANEIADEFFAPLDARDRNTLHELLARLAAVHDPRCIA